MGSSAKEKAEPEKIGWDWWNRPGINKGTSGSYQLNRLAIGNPLETARGTSQLKNISSNSPGETTGIDRPTEWGLIPNPGIKPIPKRPEPPPKPPGSPSGRPKMKLPGIIRGER
jgi:hypothetical protein